MGNNICTDDHLKPLQDSSSAISSIADLKFAGADRQDFHILSGSCAINKGNPSIGLTVKRDIDGILCPQGKGIDIGAYEFAAKNR